jgi:hypothetical protein
MGGVFIVKVINQVASTCLYPIVFEGGTEQKENNRFLRTTMDSQMYR